MSFKDRLAFFQNAVSQNSNPPSNSRPSGSNSSIRKEQNSKNSSSTNAANNHQNSTLKTQKANHQINDIPKPKSEESKKDVPTSSPDGGFAAKMAFFKNQVNTQSAQTNSSPNKEMHRQRQEPIKMSKQIQGKEDHKTKLEEPKKEVSNSKSSSNGGFAEKMAFFNNKVNNQKSEPQQTEQEKHKKTESSHSKTKLAEKVALFNNLAVPLGKPAERIKKSHKIDNESNMLNQREPSTVSGMLEIHKENDDIIMAKNEESNHQEMAIRRQIRCKNQRRRPNHIPEL